MNGMTLRRLGLADQHDSRQGNGSVMMKLYIMTVISIVPNKMTKKKKHPWIIIHIFKGSSCLLSSRIVQDSEWSVLFMTFNDKALFHCIRCSLFYMFFAFLFCSLFLWHSFHLILVMYINICTCFKLMFAFSIFSNRYMLL